jgi:hypothetical protein
MRAVRSRKGLGTTTLAPWSRIGFISTIGTPSRSRLSRYAVSSGSKCLERCPQRAKPAKNVSIARLKAEGWWRLAAWPASGITTFVEPEIFAAM